MTNYREIPRLASLSLNNSQIVASNDMSRTTVIKALRRARTAGLDWQSASEMSDKELAENHNVIILGATGSGKTYLSNALGMTASRNFYSVRYVRLPDLLGELAVARGEGTYRKVIKTYKQVKLLILDEWLLFLLKEAILDLITLFALL